MTFKDLPQNLQPREKASKQGIASLTDIELLALILRTGTREKDVLELSKEFISRHKSFRYMSFLSVEDIIKIKGIGKTRALEFIAIFELFRRMNNSKPSIIKNIDQAIVYASSLIESWDKECFIVLLLDVKDNLLYSEVLYKSDSISININPKDIVSLVLSKKAHAFYCLHNHPSGNENPSKADKMFAFRLNNICEFLDLKLINNVVFTKDKKYSKI